MRWHALLLLALPTLSEAARFDMGGKCAALFHSQKWLDEDELHNWDYKVRVEPWTVFAHVTVKLHGVGMQIEHIYGATGKVGGSSTTVELNAVGGGGVPLCRIKHNSARARPAAHCRCAMLHARTSKARTTRPCESSLADGQVARTASRSQARVNPPPTPSSLAPASSHPTSCRAARHAPPPMLVHSSPNAAQPSVRDASAPTGRVASPLRRLDRSAQLGIQFHIVSLMRPGEDGGGESGAFNAALHVATWVEPTDVTLSFDKPLIIRDVWNSFIVDGGVQSKNVVFRLKKQVWRAPTAARASALWRVGRNPRDGCASPRPSCHMAGGIVVRRAEAVFRLFCRRKHRSAPSRHMPHKGPAADSATAIAAERSPGRPALLHRLAARMLPRRRRRVHPRPKPRPR